MMNSKLKNIILMPMNLLYRISPTLELKLMFRLKQGYSLKLDNPTTFNEKLQWMKLNWNSSVREQCSDKYEVRKYVEKRCPEILPQLYWHGFKAEEIPFEKLPDKFVIKVTHGSGFNIICKDKKKLDINRCKRNIDEWLKSKYLPCYGEEFYGKIKPSVIVEEYIESESELIDYKVMCFDGIPYYVWCVFDRFSEMGPQGAVFDLNWKYQKGVYLSYPLRDKERLPERPEVLEELLRYAEILSRDLPHVRVDMYIVGKKIVFGEMSFSHGAGFDKISPYAFDKELGDLFHLPQ